MINSRISIPELREFSFDHIRSVSEQSKFVIFVSKICKAQSDSIFFDGVARKNIDAKSFEIIDHSYAKVAAPNHCKDEIIPGADAASFRPFFKAATNT